jgi:hypothetical protein
MGGEDMNCFQFDLMFQWLVFFVINDVSGYESDFKKVKNAWNEIIPASLVKALISEVNLLK